MVGLKPYKVLMWDAIFDVVRFSCFWCFSASVEWFFLVTLHEVLIRCGGTFSAESTERFLYSGNLLALLLKYSSPSH